MWVRKRIDIGWRDLLAGIVRCFLPPDRKATTRRIEARFSAEGNGFACLSVRTGFDLLLAALDLPPGSEVLMSAVTIRDMVRIVERHGLTAVPVDLDMNRLVPKLDSLREAITSRTRAIVVAHLFGTRVPLDPIIAIAKEHGLLVIEDCAQAFVGDEYKGHPDSDAAMFSFGPIKTNTALAGAVLRVRDRGLLQRMRDIEATYPLQSRWPYFFRLLKYVAVKVMSAPWFLGSLAWACRLMGTNHDGLASGMARGFSGPDFFQAIRRRSSTPLLGVLERRLDLFDHDQLRRRTEKGRRLLQQMNGTVFCPGADSEVHSFWVFPIVVEEPQPLLEKLWAAGFDATQESSMRIVPPPPGREHHSADEAESMLRRITYLPFSPNMPTTSLDQMADLVLRNSQPAGTKEPERETVGSI